MNEKKDDQMKELKFVVMSPQGFPAFPTEHHQGLTMRDYFAAKAMQGLCVNSTVSQDMAKAAYAMADAMLKERDK